MEAQRRIGAMKARAARKNGEGELQSDFKVCQLGLEQTPIDLGSGIKGDVGSVDYDYKPLPLRSTTATQSRSTPTLALLASSAARAMSFCSFTFTTRASICWREKISISNATSFTRRARARSR